QRDARSLDFPDGSFDAVYSFGVLQHTEGIHGVETAVREIERSGVALQGSPRHAEHAQRPLGRLRRAAVDVDAGADGAGADDPAGVGADAGPDLQHALAGPVDPGQAFEDVRLERVALALDIQKELARQPLARTQLRIAGLTVPVGSHPLLRNRAVHD